MPYHCHGGGFPDSLFGLTVQGECGSAELHYEHFFTDEQRVCLGAPLALAEADCGHQGPHGEHPMNRPPAPAA